MDSYELKKQLEAIYHRPFKDLPDPSRNVLLRESDIAQFHRIPMNNARMLPMGASIQTILHYKCRESVCQEPRVFENTGILGLGNGATNDCNAYDI